MFDTDLIQFNKNEDKLQHYFAEWGAIISGGLNDFWERSAWLPTRDRGTTFSTNEENVEIVDEPCMFGDRHVNHIIWLSAETCEPTELTQNRQGVLKWESPILGMHQSAHVCDATKQPKVSEEITQAIEESRYILELEENYDDQESPRYLEETWERATNFLKENALNFWEQQNTWIVAPRILPGPEGSIDLHWKIGEKELLINIPSDPAEVAEFYGDDAEKDKIKGTLDTSKKYEWILLWLM